MQEQNIFDSITSTPENEKQSETDESQETVSRRESEVEKDLKLKLAEMQRELQVLRCKQILTIFV